MHITLLIMDLVGTIAFAISGAVLGIKKKMDIFGINLLAITTACGGGILRDIIVGEIPPKAFKNPFYVGVAFIVANIIFIWLSFHKKMPQSIVSVYDRTVFWFDTLGLAAFTVDGVMIGINAGYEDNIFLIVFLGFITGVGGGALRDMMANQMPDILRKHVYAVASIAGGIIMAITYNLTNFKSISALLAFISVVILRYLAAKFEWNLPKLS
ncbi:trimeric intracellular cation channel family protein [Pseudobutyrivibrio sp. MD2005]|uniref:trimeric intracellular cation channel family protein n=1 Tax=Pseudobutyrivibrio sp. MD2005 TaxID=1410616 RepID=UPI0004850127|nr:trimeric intracellular cation channel family protein [Pseudobutyrivibrio sp. MD2005]